MEVLERISGAQQPWLTEGWKHTDQINGNFAEHNSQLIDITQKLSGLPEQLQWFEPVYQNGWVGFHDSTYSLKYAKDRTGIVYLSGLFNHSSIPTAGTVIFEMPPGFKSRRVLIYNLTPYNRIEFGQFRFDLGRLIFVNSPEPSTSVPYTIDLVYKSEI